MNEFRKVVSEKVGQLEPQKRQGPTAQNTDLSPCIANPEDLMSDGKSTGRPQISCIDAKKGLEVNLKTIQRARTIFQRFLK